MADFETVHDALDHSGLPGVGGSLGAWTDYTPTWGASSAPSLADGTIVGRYKLLDSTTLAVSIVLTMGGSTTYGSGAWTFTLPAGVTSAARLQVFSAMCIDVGSVVFHSATARVSSSATTIGTVIAADGTGSRQVSNTIPFTWANTDVLIISGMFEIA